MSKTDENLRAAVAAESLVRNRYAYYAQVARKEGYLYIAKIFEEIAENEKYHAMGELELLMKGCDTAMNLRAAIEDERDESENVYPRYATEAEVEGDRAAAILFQQISKIERQHHDRFEKLLSMVESGTVFKRDVPIKWKCSVCGYTYEGLEPPKRCPYCKRPRECYEPANLDV
jgi:rubrerythrin